jgi:hypothetical protein
MEVSAVRKQVHAAIERGKKAAAEQRERADLLSREYDAFLPDVAVPLFRQVATVLKAEGHPFTVSTPGGSVKLAADKNNSDFIELALDVAGGEPQVLLRSTRARGRRVVEKERPIPAGALTAVTDDQLLAMLLEELEPFLSR